jgi:hypothetical protein
MTWESPSLRTIRIIGIKGQLQFTPFDVYTCVKRTATAGPVCLPLLHAEIFERLPLIARAYLSDFSGFDELLLRDSTRSRDSSLEIDRVGTTVGDLDTLNLFSFPKRWASKSGYTKCRVDRASAEIFRDPFRLRLRADIRLVGCTRTRSRRRGAECSTLPLSSRPR